MKPLASSLFPGLSQRFEGRTAWPYLDVRGLVTVGVGCLADPETLFSPLPWLDVSTGLPAVPEAVQAGFVALKGAPPGRLATFYVPMTTLRLNEAAIDALLLSRAAIDEDVLRGGLPNYDDAPDAAQIGVMSLAWAMGGAGVLRGFPHFCDAFKRGDWTTCAHECSLSTEENPGVAPRNRANAALFLSIDAGTDPRQVLETLF